GLGGPPEHDRRRRGVPQCSDRGARRLWPVFGGELHAVGAVEVSPRLDPEPLENDAAELRLARRERGDALEPRSHALGIEQQREDVVRHEHATASEGTAASRTSTPAAVWRSKMRWYQPPARASWACVPDSMSRPPESTRIRSACWTSSRRWATRKLVFPR